MMLFQLQNNIHDTCAHLVCFVVTTKNIDPKIFSAYSEGRKCHPGVSGTQSSAVSGYADCPVIVLKK
jgi:hypothetical protein